MTRSCKRNPTQQYNFILKSQQKEKRRFRGAK